MDGTFSLTRGGPLYRGLLRAGLVDRRGHVRKVWLAMIGWLPLAVLALIDRATGTSVAWAWIDLSVHVRLLVLVPLLFVAEEVLDARCREAIGLVELESLCEASHLTRIRTRIERLRDSRLVEGGLALLALLGGQLTFWLHGRSGFLDGPGVPMPYGFANAWYAMVAVPAVQFLLARWLWRWAIWVYGLVSLARLPLATNALHPDCSAGLKFLAEPVDGFAVFVGANASLLSAAWFTRIHEGQVTLAQLTPTFFGIVALALLMGCGPLMLFMRQLYRARCRELITYHASAHDVTRAFRRKWLTDQRPHERPDLALLDANDFSALIDMDSSFQVAESTQVWSLCKRAVVRIVACALAPMLPVILTAVGVAEIARRAGGMLLGFGG